MVPLGTKGRQKRFRNANLQSLTKLSLRWISLFLLTDFPKVKNLNSLFYVVIQILRALFFDYLIFCSFFKYFISRSLPLFLVRRKRTQALLGSNLLAILLTDTLYKGRFSNLPFTYTGIQIWLKKTPCCDLSQYR